MQLTYIVHDMHANAANRLSVADIAHAVGSPVRSLQRAFQETFGRSPMQYLRDLRLDMARQMLLAHPNAGVTQIALDCGFNHLGKFAAAYRDRFGEPPSATARR